MSEQPAVTTFRRCFSVGRFRCELTAQLVAGHPVSIQTAWTPPYPERLHPILFKEYRQKRNRAYAALAKQAGGPVVIIDCDGAGVWGSMEQKTHISLSLASRCLDSVAIKTEKPV